MTHEWQDLAACNGTDTESFFPEHQVNITKYADQVQDGVQALRVCQRCPVIAECFAYAMANSSSIYAGIYGGTMPYERQELAKKQGKCVIPGGAPGIDKSIRKLATEQGINAPTIGVRPLEGTRNMELYFSV